MKSGLVSCCSYRLLWHHILLAWDCNNSGGQEKTNSHHCHIQLLLKCLATLHNFRNYKIITGENSNQNCKIVNVCLWKISSNISWYLRISSMLFQPGSCWWNHKKSSRRKKKKRWYINNNKNSNKGVYKSCINLWRNFQQPAHPTSLQSFGVSTQSKAYNVSVTCNCYFHKEFFCPNLSFLQLSVFL